MLVTHTIGCVAVGDLAFLNWGTTLGKFPNQLSFILFQVYIVVAF